MKTLLNSCFLLILSCISIQLRGQNVAINDNGTVGNVHSILDVDVSTNDKGILIPRITTAERTAIGGLGPVDEGLMVYDISTKSFWFWDGTVWVQMQASTSGWLTTGNAGTAAGTNFIGTTDNQSLDIRTNNVIKSRITTKGQIEILNTGNSIFIGEAAGASDDLSTNRNNFIGYQSGNLTTTGFNNNGVGYQSLYNNTVGQENAAFGFRSLFSNTTGYNNSGFGDQSLWQNTTGIFNSAVGGQALYANTTGNNNTAMGTGSLFFNTTASNNSAFGVQTLGQNTTGTENAAFGYQALYVNSTASKNVGVGAYALTSNTVGASNTAVGFSTMHNNTTATGNVAVGESALFTQSFSFGGTPYASCNVAVGFRSLYFNQPTSAANGTSNTAVGYESMRFNTTGSYNSAFGRHSLNANTTGDHNVGVGYSALGSNTTGARNTSVGYTALMNNTAGVQNIAVGTKALRDNQTGNHNVGVGYESLLLNQSGEFNTGLGTGSLYNNTTASWNVALGAGSLSSSSIGSYNTGVGAQTLGQSTTASQNTAVGFQALYVQSFNNGGTAWNSNNVAVGYQALWSNLSTNTTNGIGNTATGCLALFNNIDGFNNTAVGINADVNAGSYNNSSCFGANSLITASNQIRIGNAAITSIGGQVGWTTLSDKRVKTNIKEDVPGIEFIKKLQPVTYEYDQETINKIIRPNGNLDPSSTTNHIRYTGFFAQDVEKAANDLGFQFSGVDAPKNKNDLYGLRYGDFTVPLVKAVQEQQVMIEDLQNQILILKKEIQVLQEKNK